MIDLPPNSYASKSSQEPQQTTPVTKGKPVDDEHEQKSIGQKFIDQFIAMKPKEVGKNLWKDVVVPSLVNLASDSITSAKNLFLFGSGAGVSSTPPVIGSGNIPYDKVGQQTRPIRPASKYNFTNVYIPSKQEAESALNSLRARAMRYGEVTLAFFYEIVDLDASIDYPTNSWGWRNGMLDKVEAKQTPYGWILTLPDIVKLN